MHPGSCHCGAIRIELSATPAWAIDCNCSICRRNGARWGLLEANQLRIDGPADGTEGYVWGARTITTHRCRVCGCVTHWQPQPENPDRRVGINLRNFEAAWVAGIRVRRFDGADRWDYVD